MKINRYNNLLQATTDLESKGYKNNFKFVKDKGLQCVENKKIYDTKSLDIVEYHRFEGDSSPTDTSILFVLECHDGIKGVIISSYGVYYDIRLMEFISKIKIKPREIMT